MLYAAKGIKAANPKNIAIMPGLSPTQLNMKNVEYFVEDIYNRIKSGEAPYGNTKSKDPDDYFGALCWHPYAKSIDESWLQSQKDVYNIVIENGDEGKKVIFSELGFSDNGVDDVEELQIGYTERVFEYCENELPSSKACSRSVCTNASMPRPGAAVRSRISDFSANRRAIKGSAPRRKHINCSRSTAAAAILPNTKRPRNREGKNDP